MVMTVGHLGTDNAPASHRHPTLLPNFENISDLHPEYSRDCEKTTVKIAVRTVLPFINCVLTCSDGLRS
jgi:hypothetical protein